MLKCSSIRSSARLSRHNGVRSARWRSAWTGTFDDYRRKRDLIFDGLSDCYEMTKPGGAFYLFPKAPIDSGGAFVEEAIDAAC